MGGQAPALTPLPTRRQGGSHAWWLTLAASICDLPHILSALCFPQECWGSQSHSNVWISFLHFFFFSIGHICPAHTILFSLSLSLAYPFSVKRTSRPLIEYALKSLFDWLKISLQSQACHIILPLHLCLTGFALKRACPWKMVTHSSIPSRSKGWKE